MEINLCPRWLLSQLRVPDRYQLHLGLFFSSILILLLLPLVQYVPHICLMRELVGVPCPGCGISHSLRALLRLDYRAAWQANPAGLAVATCLCFQVVGRPIAVLAANAEQLISKTSMLISDFVIGSLLLVWITKLI